MQPMPNLLNINAPSILAATRATAQAQAGPPDPKQLQNIVLRTSMKVAGIQSRLIATALWRT